MLGAKKFKLPIIDKTCTYLDALQSQSDFSVLYPCMNSRTHLNSLKDHQEYREHSRGWRKKREIGQLFRQRRRSYSQMQSILNNGFANAHESKWHSVAWRAP